MIIINLMLINFALNTALFLYGLIYDTRILWLMIGVIGNINN